MPAEVIETATFISTTREISYPHSRQGSDISANKCIGKGGEHVNVRKGVLINLSFMKELDKRVDGIYAVMQDGSEFRVSRRKGKALMRFIEAPE